MNESPANIQLRDFEPIEADYLNRAHRTLVMMRQEYDQYAAEPRLYVNSPREGGAKIDVLAAIEGVVTRRQASLTKKMHAVIKDLEAYRKRK